MQKVNNMYAWARWLNKKQRWGSKSILAVKGAQMMRVEPMEAVTRWPPPGFVNDPNTPPPSGDTQIPTVQPPPKAPTAPSGPIPPVESWGPPASKKKKGEESSEQKEPA